MCVPLFFVASGERASCCWLPLGAPNTEQRALSTGQRGNVCITKSSSGHTRGGAFSIVVIALMSGRQTSFACQSPFEIGKSLS